MWLCKIKEIAHIHIKKTLVKVSITEINFCPTFEIGGSVYKSAGALICVYYMHATPLLWAVSVKRLQVFLHSLSKIIII